MGLTEDAFLDMTPRQFFAWQRGEVNRYRENAELIRAAAYMISAPNLKQGTTPAKFWPLPWDVAPKFEPQDKQEADYFRQRAKMIFEKKRANGNHSGT